MLEATQGPEHSVLLYNVLLQVLQAGRRGLTHFASEHFPRATVSPFIDERAHCKSASLSSPTFLPYGAVECEEN